MSVPEFHEVRVRARGVRLNPDSNATSQVSTRSDFIAPDMSPVSTHQIEMDKGSTGWTDKDKRVESTVPVFTDWAKRDLVALSIGKAIVTRKSPTTPLVKRNAMGPSTRTRSKYC